MSTISTDNEARLRSWIIAFVDGTIEQPEMDAMMQAIASDPAMAQRYVELMEVHAALQWERPAVERPVEAPAPKPALRIERTETRSHRWVYALAAAIAVACGLAVYFVAISTDEVPTDERPQARVAIATLIESTGGTLRTPHDYPSEGRQYAAGEYALDAGHAQFLLTNRVTVNLIGDTRLRMRSPMRVAMAHGRAEFKVPSDATGFTVDLPDKTQIIDLGTAFSLDVDDTGRADVRVTEGQVAWTTDGPLAESYLIEAMESAQFVDGRVHVRAMPDAPWLIYLNRMNDDPAMLDGTRVDRIANAEDRFGGETAYRPAGDKVQRLVVDAGAASSSMTLATWVKMDEVGERLTAIVVSESDAPGRMHWQIQPGGAMTLGTNQSAGAKAYRASKVLDKSHVDRWAHLAVVADADAKSVRFYIDGEPAGHRRMHTKERYTIAGAVIGDSKRWPGRRLNGQIDDLIALERAMTQTEVKELYKAGVPPQTQKERSR